jgi:hypothetical protein
MPRHTSQTTAFLGMLLAAAAALGQSSPGGAEEMRCSLVLLFLSIPVSAVNPTPEASARLEDFGFKLKFFLSGMIKSATPSRCKRAERGDGATSPRSVLNDFKRGGTLRWATTTACTGI